VTLGRRDLDEAREEQWNGSRRRGGAGLGVAEGGAVLDRLGVAEGIVEVQGEAKAGGGAAHVGGGRRRGAGRCTRAKTGRCTRAEAEGGAAHAGGGRAVGQQTAGPSGGGASVARAGARAVFF
jgi:hypothetical protein